MRAVVAGIALLAVLSAACRSTPPARNYTLNMTPSGPPTSGLAIDVQRIRSLEPVARRDIMVKKTPTQVEYYALDQWAADPGQLVAEKLQAEFGYQPEAPKRITVSGELVAFEEVDGPQGATAHVKLDLEFRRADQDRFDEPALRKRYELTVPVEGTGADAVARALSGALEQLADQVAADAAGL
jgi:ABC-type uncharacterized transport system auxiliary subunit